MIYLDNNATTPVLPDVMEAMLPFFTDSYGNPSSAHTMGRKARAAVERARQQVADLIGAEREEIVFTSGATEGNQSLLHMFGQAAVVTTAVEHPSILKVIDTLPIECKHLLPVDSEGQVYWNAPEFESGLCSVMWANNETGVISPVETIAKQARENGLLFHSDAAQAVGKVPVVVGDWVDYLSISAHKLFGPKGIGALYVREGSPFTPIFPGSQEDGLRGGTEAVPLIVGFGVAAEKAEDELADRVARCNTLRDLLEERILSEVEGTSVNGGGQRLPNTTNIRFSGVDGDALVSMLSQNGIMASTSSACQASSITPSHVLLAYGLSYDAAGQAIRFSVSHLNSESDIEAAVDALVMLTQLLGA